MCKWYMYTHIELVLLVFMKSGTFCMKNCTFHEKYKKSTWKQLKRTWKTTKTADSTQISHFDMVFHRVQREGQLSISYILVVFGGVNGACMFKWYMYTHKLIWFCWFSWKVMLFFMKTGTSCEKHWKATKTSDSTQISHYDLVFHKYRGNANYVYVIFYWYLVELVCVNGACIHTYWTGFFSWKVALFMKSTWKPLKSNKKTADLTHISYYYLVFCRVQKEGQLDISYILVVLVGVCGACMFKFVHVYTHIDLVLLVFMNKWCFLCENWYFSWKAHEKYWKL